MKHLSFFKLALLCSLCCLVFEQSRAQSNVLQEQAYEDMLQQADSTHKLLFIAVHSRAASFSPLPIAISKKTQARLQEQFVCGTVRLNPDEYQHPLQKEYAFRSPAFLLLDSLGYPLLRQNTPIKSEAELRALLDSAAHIAQGETMGKLMLAYQKGMRQKVLLRKLLSYHQSFDRYVDEQLMNDYLAQLRIEELNNFETVAFLYNSGPVYNSKAYRLIRTNAQLIDSVFARLSLPKREQLNGRVFRRTFREALNKEQQMIAQELGNVVSRSWGNHFLRARMANRWHLMEYQRLHLDSMAYIVSAKYYYENFYYRVSPDSLAKMDFAYRLGRQPMTMKLDSTDLATFQTYMLHGGRKKAHAAHAKNLSYGVQQVLRFVLPHDDRTLYDAIRWQQRAIELQPGRAQDHYALAQLLYRVALYEQAEAEQERAVRLSKSYKPYQQEMQEALRKLRARTW